MKPAKMTHSSYECNWAYKPGHPKENNRGSVRSYILIAESVLEKGLPKGIIIHHVDGNRKNDSNNNLVICEDIAYHKLIHARERAYRACGNANWRRCKFCKQYDDPVNLYIPPKIRGNGTSAYHSECVNKYNRNLKRRKENENKQTYNLL